MNEQMISVLDDTGKTLVTKELQSLLDLASENDEIFVLSKGIYLTGPLFLHSNQTIVFEEGAVLLAATDEKEYQKIDTRIAGIEMKGYPAILNIIDAVNVRITGKGTIIGQGEPWYEKYWGKDQKGGMRKEYDALGLRWACDYDCHRPKNLLVQNSKHITITGLTLKDSPFWNLHVLYSNDVMLDSLLIDSSNPNSPSTDGIDIDSSFDVEIKNCEISTNDDCISIKSGRDVDGLRVNRPTRDVHIHDCVIKRGYGISLGSELSGGIYGIQADHIHFLDSDCGFRIKSSKNRKGYVKDITLSNFVMKDVMYPFYCYLDWNKGYNDISVPTSYQGIIRDYWLKLLQKPGDEIPDTLIDGIQVDGVDIFYSEDYQKTSCLFTFKGFENSGIHHLVFKNIKAKIKEYGTFVNCDEPAFESCQIDVTSKEHTVPGSFDNR